MRFGFRERAKQPSKQEALKSSEQIAFSTAANELIFNQPHDVSLSKENAREISHIIQDDFLDLHKGSITAVNLYVAGALEQIKESIASIRESMPDTPIREEDDKIAPTADYSPRDVLILYEYQGWGFTPKLASSGSGENKEENKLQMQLNCLGNAILTGAHMRKEGKSPKLCVSVDHPEVAVVTDGVAYFCNIAGSVTAQDGTLTDHGTYQVLRLKDDSKELQKFFFVFDFDDAVLYETLENLEVLRKMSLGEEVENLPGTEVSGMELAQKHAPALQGANWKEIQRKLFPDFVKAFEEHSEEFATQTEEVRAGRIMILASVILERALHKAQSATSFGHVGFGVAQQKIMELSQGHGVAVADFLYNDVPFASETPSDIVHFYTTLKENIVDEHIEPEQVYKARALIYLQMLSHVCTEDELKAHLARAHVS